MSIDYMYLLAGAIAPLFRFRLGVGGRVVRSLWACQLRPVRFLSLGPFHTGGNVFCSFGAPRESELEIKHDQCRRLHVACHDE